jgi:uncharacterized protein (DUF302 family)
MRANEMSYYFTKIIDGSFDEAVSRIKEELKKEGFGILTDIDIKETLKKKLNADIHQYRILGACNPPYAYQALQIENKIGLMLPCNVIVQEIEDGKIEVSAIDPSASMQATKNKSLKKVAGEIREKLIKVIENL